MMDEIEMSVSVRIYADGWTLPRSAEGAVWYANLDMETVIGRLLEAKCIIAGGEINERWSRLDIDLPELRLRMQMLIELFGNIVVDVFNDGDDDCVMYLRVGTDKGELFVDQVDQETGLRFACETPADAAHTVMMLAAARLAYEGRRRRAVKSTDLTAR